MFHKIFKKKESKEYKYGFQTNIKINIYRKILNK